MGRPEQFAKRTFTRETEPVTGGALTWLDPPPIGLTWVQGDGLLAVRRPELLALLAPPWSEAWGYDEILIELKMSGDHLDVQAVERALLRRQARQVQRVEAVKRGDPPWLGQEPLWIVAPCLPDWLGRVRPIHGVAPGCYRVEPVWTVPFLWIAANELPLRDELVPFLVTRSGRALEEFARWVAPRRPLDWLLDMVRYTAMSTVLTKEWLEEFARPDEDPEVAAKQHLILQALLKAQPQVQRELIDEGRLAEARAALRHVLARRGLAPSADDDARIEACADLPTLERWLDQAIVASSAAEALQ